MPRSRGREWPTFQRASLELSIALWSRLRPVLLDGLDVIEAFLAFLRRLRDGLTWALWRLIWSTGTDLSEHEARQILRATQKKAKGREIHAPSPLSYPFQRPRGPVR